jgi:hypothetical protein
MDFRRAGRDHVDIIRLDHGEHGNKSSGYHKGWGISSTTGTTASFPRLFFMESFSTQRPVRTDFPIQNDARKM